YSEKTKRITLMCKINELMIVFWYDKNYHLRGELYVQLEKTGNDLSNYPSRFSDGINARNVYNHVVCYIRHSIRKYDDNHGIMFIYTSTNICTICWCLGG